MSEEKMSTPKYKDFEDYLQEYFMRQNPHLLDDDIPDAFADWLSDLDTDDWLRLGDLYGKAIIQVEELQVMIRTMKERVL